MQLELIQWEPAEPPWSMVDPNRGMYSDPLEYFWDYAANGHGIDEFRWGTIVATFFITQADVALFPELSSYRQVLIWEDEEEGVKMWLLKPDAKCVLCQDSLHNHTTHNCEALI